MRIVVILHDRKLNCLHSPLQEMCSEYYVGKSHTLGLAKILAHFHII